MYKPNGYIQQLVDYIKKNLSKGYTLDSLRYSLITQGYSKISVEKAIETANKQLAEKAPIIKEKPEIIYRIIYNDDAGKEKIAEISLEPEEEIEKQPKKEKETEETAEKIIQDIIKEKESIWRRLRFWR